MAHLLLVFVLMLTTVSPRTTDAAVASDSISADGLSSGGALHVPAVSPAFSSGDPRAHPAPILLADKKHKGKKNDDEDGDRDDQGKIDCTKIPPGLDKDGKVPPGLEKQGKIPRGWLKKCRSGDAVAVPAPGGKAATPVRSPNWAANDVECKELALRSSGETLTEALKGAAVGGAIGAAAGAAVGATQGTTQKGAIIGGSAGAAAGALKQGTAAEKQFKQAYSNCMQGRGEPLE